MAQDHFSPALLDRFLSNPNDDGMSDLAGDFSELTGMLVGGVLHPAPPPAKRPASFLPDMYSDGEPMSADANTVTSSIDSSSSFMPSTSLPTSLPTSLATSLPSLADPHQQQMQQQIQQLQQYHMPSTHQHHVPPPPLSQASQTPHDMTNLVSCAFTGVQAPDTHKPVLPIPTDDPALISDHHLLAFQHTLSHLPQAPPAPVQQSSPVPASSQSDTSEDDARPQRQRKSHNAIEKKYRNSINDKIVELKDMLPPAYLQDAKTNKASILRLSIDYIRHLKSENEALHARLAGKAQPQPQAKAQSTTTGGHSPTSDQDNVPDSPPSIASDATRLLMCGFLVLLCFITPTGSNAAANAQHSGARVLSSIDDSNSLMTWAYDYGLWFLLRVCTILICLFAMFAKDPSAKTESVQSKAAVSHAKQCRTILAESDNPEYAEWHANMALKYTGFTLPTSTVQVTVSLAWQAVRQLLHTARVGLWLDRYFANTEQDDVYSTTALATHMLHSIKASQHPATVALDGTYSNTSSAQLLRALAALNAMETCASMEPAEQANIYLAAAIQVRLSTGMTLMSRYLFAKAQNTLMEARGGNTSRLAWVVRDQAKHFAVSGAWTQLEIKQDGQILRPGTVQHLASAYCQHLFRQVLDQFVAGQDTQLVLQQLQELHDCAEATSLAEFIWLSLAIKTIVLWRRGDLTSATDCLRQLDDTVVTLDHPKRALFYSLLATQALQRGLHAECWKALAEASTLFQHIVRTSTPQAGVAQDISVRVTLLGLRLALDTRVNIYRVQAHVAATQAKSGKGHPTIDFARMRDCLATDVAVLKHMSNIEPQCEPMSLMYQAILRGMYGGRVRPTYQLFSQSIRQARRMGLLFDEAVAGLHMCSCLRSHLPVQDLEHELRQVAASFERLDAKDYLSSSHKLLRLVSMRS
eukprot:m.32305 g.32305  ORF g.32305 m.32305 type:complete len:922 (+) comp9503_c0_seq1:700-3465(+)